MGDGGHCCALVNASVYVEGFPGVCYKLDVGNKDGLLNEVIRLIEDPFYSVRTSS